MTSRFSLPLLISALAALFLTGCYDRWTGNYDEVPELKPNNSAIVAVSEFSKKDIEERRKILKQVIAEKPPVYTINGGDKLSIMVYNHSDLSVQTIVTPDGYIGMVLVGQIKIAGLTLDQASRKIEEALAKYIRNPKVGLYPYEIVSETVTISGAVSKPGIYTISNGMRLSEIFARSGGAASRLYDGQTLSAADYASSIFIRNKKHVPVDFSLAIEKGDPLHNIVLRSGDYIYIAAREDSMVYLMGEVKRPGRFMWNRNLGLLELITYGGWLNDTYWNYAIIIRGGLSNPKMYKVDLDAIIHGPHRNIPVQAGDIVFIPKDNISEYNVFVRKLFPTAQLINMLLTPAAWVSGNVL